MNKETPDTELPGALIYTIFPRHQTNKTACSKSGKCTGCLSRPLSVMEPAGHREHDQSQISGHPPI